MISIDELFLLSRQYLEHKAAPYTRRWLAEKIAKPRLTILIGQRGIGKTTLIIQALLKFASNNTTNKDILYVPCDHFLLGDYTLYEIAENFTQQGGKQIAFDEIHKYEAWSKELKSIYDTFPHLKILASGSSALEIYKGSHDLSRRAIIYPIKGFSFREYLELSLGISFPALTLQEILINHEKISSTIIKTLGHTKILPEFKRYLRIGYYPHFLETQDEEMFFVTLDQNFHITIESDLPAIYPALTGNSIRKIKQLLIFIGGMVPFTPQFKKLQTLLEIGDARTLKTYFKYLEDAGLIRQVHTASQKLHRLETPEKIYLDNTNQLFAITPHQQNPGTIRELFFLMMLSIRHQLAIPKSGDFLVDRHWLFEIGGKKKDFEQIKEEELAYLACDELEVGIHKKIPLWLFGFLY